MSYNRFKNSNKSKKHYSLNMNDYPQLFPTLKNNENELNNELQSKNFADAILKPIDIIEDNSLKPGWISIKKMKNNKLHYEYGPPLNNKWITKHKKEDTPNEIMNNIISKINSNRERYRMEYNSINGAYAFEDFYEKSLSFNDEDEDENDTINDDNWDYNNEYENGDF